MTAAAASFCSIRIEALNWDMPILIATDRESISIRAGTIVEIGDAVHRFSDDTPVVFDKLEAGKDYAVSIDASGRPIAEDVSQKNPLTADYFAGFHFAPGGNAWETAGGDIIPAINPHSLWNLGFQPSCLDPRGMAAVEVSGRRVWVDIYLLGVDHHLNGTSRHGATIADGYDLPMRPDGSAYKKLDYATAAEIYAHHGKRLLGAEEFFAAAYGVKERCSRSEEPATTGNLDDGAVRFISRHGIFDVTGTMWQWGTDGHPDDPRPSIFGGSWLNGSNSGSRYAALVYWAGVSSGSISARGASDHMAPA